MAKIPHISPDEFGIKTLFVDDKPYLMLGGELHNSSASNLDYMSEKVWPAIKELNLDTVILPIYWETIEPQEGTFDFTLSDGLLAQARKEQVKLVVLWFGLWKNGESTYVPSWVKRDYKRFFRACYTENNPSETISPCCAEAIKSDAKAFAAMMKHLKEVDGEENTVIMVQVENEVGFLGAQRDYSEVASMAYLQEIPTTVGECYNCAGTWSAAFSEDACEMFMAYNYATAIEQVVAAGKEEYPLPMYVNAWLEQFPSRPGSYPSGGPIAKVMPLWKKVATSLDLMAPDIYLPDFMGVCDAYTANSNPLFIPEARRDPVTASNVFYAFGQYNTIGFSPFAVEDFMSEQFIEIDEKLTDALSIDAKAFCCVGTGPYLQKSYELLQNIKPLLLSCRGTQKLQAFIKKNNNDKGCILKLSKCDVELTYLNVGKGKPESAGFVIEISPEAFYVIGCNVKIKPLSKKSSESKVTIVRMEEGNFTHGVFNPTRILNGDELTQSLIKEYAGTLKYEICTHERTIRK